MKDQVSAALIESIRDQVNDVLLELQALIEPETKSCDDGQAAYNNAVRDDSAAVIRWVPGDDGKQAVLKTWPQLRSVKVIAKRLDNYSRVIRRV